MTDKETLKLALDALEYTTNLTKFLLKNDANIGPILKADQAITAIKEALAQPEQEPRNIRERWNIEFDGDDLLVCFNDHEKSEGCRYERYVPATTTPPQRTWVGLTDEEKLHLEIMGGKSDVMLAEVIEAKLKEKNT